MNHIHKTQSRNIEKRNTLLQTSPRPDPLPYKIQSEYPIVLDPNNCEFSHCLEEDGDILAHANLWPRLLVNQQGKTIAKLGLIGNVATHEDHRGRGIMKSLFQYLESKAILANMDALILWSDLSVFYQKLGFQSLSEEFHYSFENSFRTPKGRHTILKAQDYNEALLKNLLNLRYPTPYTIERSSREFQRLLSIPSTHLIVSRSKSDEIDAYCIIGKGYDMNGVIHEWGFQKSSDTLIEMIKYALKTFEYNEILLLCPGNISTELARELKLSAKSFNSQSMCHAKILSADEGIKKALNQSFIWGLDSI